MALLIFPTQISNYIFKDPSFKFLIYFSIPLMWSTVMNLTMLAILNGLKEFKTFSIFNMLIALFPAILILIFSENMSIEMIVLSYLFSSLLITFFLFLNLLPFLKNVIKSLRFIQVSKLSLIIKFGITSLVTGLIVTLSILIFRNMIISSSAEGLQYAGLWESLFRLSTFYNLIIFSPISIYFLPKFSSENSFIRRKNKILKISKMVIAFTLLACSFSILFGDQIILFLFSNDFLQISSLIWLIILAETLRIIGSTFHLENIVKERFKLIVLIEATSYFLFLLSLYLFILNDSFSLLYASICYLLCTSTFMLLNIVTFYLFSAWSKKNINA